MNIKKFMQDFRITNRTEVERCAVKCEDCTFKRECRYSRFYRRKELK